MRKKSAIARRHHVVHTTVLYEFFYFYCADAFFDLVDLIDKIHSSSVVNNNCQSTHYYQEERTL